MTTIHTTLYMGGVTRRFVGHVNGTDAGVVDLLAGRSARLVTVAVAAGSTRASVDVGVNELLLAVAELVSVDALDRVVQLRRDHLERNARSDQQHDGFRSRAEVDEPVGSSQIADHPQLSQDGSVLLGVERVGPSGAVPQRVLLSHDSPPVETRDVRQHVLQVEDTVGAAADGAELSSAAALSADST